MFSSKEPTVLKMAVYVTDAMINFSDKNRGHGNIYNLIEVAISYIKKHNSYSWEYQPKGFYQLDERVATIKSEGKWQEVRDVYLERKMKMMTLIKNPDQFLQKP